MQRPRYMAAGRVSNSSDARSLTASCHRVSVLHSHAQIAQLIESSQGICACPTEPSWSTSTSVAGVAPHMHRPDAWCPEPNPKPHPRYSRPARPSEARQGIQLALGTAAAMHRRDVDLAAGLEPRCGRSCCNRRVDNRRELGDALDRVHAGCRLERELLPGGERAT